MANNQFFPTNKTNTPLISNISALASGQTITWQKCLGGSDEDSANSVIQTKDGGYLIGGYAESNDGNVTGNHGDKDYWIVKVDTTGSLEWQKCLGGSNWDYATSVIQTSDGGYLAGGYTWSNDGDVAENHGTFDYWIVKMDNTGSLVWQKCLGGSNWDYATSVIQTSDGGYLVGGYTLSVDGDVAGNHGIFDSWIVKLDATGFLVWQKCLGGSSDDYATSVIQTNDGGYIACGATWSDDEEVIGYHGKTDYWIVKVDATGSFVWQKCLGGSNHDSANSVIQTSDGGYIACGATWSDDGDVTENHGYFDYWIVKIDAKGSLVWQKCFGGSYHDYATSVIQTSDSGYIVSGSTQSTNGDVTGIHGYSDYWIIKIQGEEDPDLIISNLSLPLSIPSLNNLSISWHVQNQGLVAGSGLWSDSLYLSKNSILDGNETLLYSVNSTRTVLPKTRYTVQPILQNTPVVDPGTYYLIASVLIFTPIGSLIS